MQITQNNGFNSFNIERLSMARLNAIVVALQEKANRGTLNPAGKQLLQQLESANIELLKLSK